MTEVRVGQIWADNDPRSAGRKLRVDAIADTWARCTVLTNSDEAQQIIDAGKPGYIPKDSRGKTTRISLKRFKPTSTGYRLIGGRVGEQSRG